MTVSPIKTEQTKEQQQLNENNPNTMAQNLNNTNSQAPNTLTDQEIPYSIPSTSISYFPPQINTIQNSTPVFQLTNSHYSPQQLSVTSEKSFVLTPQLTNFSTFTTQESNTTISTSKEPVITSVCPLQSGTKQDSIHQSPIIFSAQNNLSQYLPINAGGTTNVTDVQNSKEISNYFTQFQTQASSSNNSNTIPMFSVKNFPQVSPLTQPLGK